MPYNKAGVKPKPITNEKHQTAIIEAMKCLAESSRDPAHALCIVPATHVKKAHDLLKSLLPDGYKLPQGAQLAAPSFGRIR